ncbi:hypothetical protein F5050DRAFT_1723833 [Lentinula boryana]|uniref:Secreted protein n=1 Tax=Lentinula boryana TaxID=40481 RepID=A0ABQ8QSH6_9AGAR|nr:hypothetical protein F5050DRAFT_1723833 [Lentinula boryana]
MVSVCYIFFYVSFFLRTSCDEISDGRTDRIPSIPKSPGVQCGGGLGCLLKCIEYLICNFTSITSQFSVLVLSFA